MTDCSTPQFTCDKCEGSQFSSRNQLFRHLRVAHLSVTAAAAVSSIEDVPSSFKRDDSDSDSSALLSTKHHSCSSSPQPLSKLPPHFIYVLGGRLRGRTLNAVQRFSSARQQWEDCPAGRMRENRGSHGAASVDGVVFAVGGGGLHSNLSSCEKFDVRLQCWQRVAALNVSRHALAVTSFGSSVYAVGGWIDGTLCSPAAEVYDCSRREWVSGEQQQHRDQWDNLPALNVARKLHGCAALDGKLYVFGGSCDEPLWHTDTAEVLDLAAVHRELGDRDSHAPSPAKKRKSSGDEHDSPGEQATDMDTGTDTGTGTVAVAQTDAVVDPPVQTKEERRGGGSGQEGGICVADTRRSTREGYQARAFSGNTKWQMLRQRLPSRGGGASAVTVGGRIFVFLHGQRGGVCCYDPAADSYSALSELPVEDWHCFDVTSVSVGEGEGSLESEEVYVVGGASRGIWSKVAYLYNTRLDSWKQLPDMPQAKRRMACSALLDASSASTSSSEGATTSTPPPLAAVNK